MAEFLSYSPAPLEGGQDRISFRPESGDIGVIQTDTRNQLLMTRVIENKGQLPEADRWTRDRSIELSDRELARQQEKKNAIRAGQEVYRSIERFESMVSTAITELKIAIQDGADERFIELSDKQEQELIEGLTFVQKVFNHENIAKRDEILSSLTGGFTLKNYKAELDTQLKAYVEEVSGEVEMSSGYLDSIYEHVLRAEGKFALDTIYMQMRERFLAHRFKYNEEGEPSNVLEASSKSVQRLGRTPDDQGEGGERVAFAEIDIRSADGIPVGHHDVHMSHLAEDPRKISDLTPEEINEVEMISGGHLATLEQVLDQVTSKTGPNPTKVGIDIKSYDEAMLDEVLRLTEGREHLVEIVSWFPQVLVYMHDKKPHLEYSLSYHPLVSQLSRAIATLYDIHRFLSGRMIVEEIEEKLVGKEPIELASEQSLLFLKSLYDLREKSSDSLVGLPEEMYRYAAFVDSSATPEEIVESAKRQGIDLRNLHTFSVGDNPFNDQMKEVLTGVNIMGFKQDLYLRNGDTAHDATVALFEGRAKELVNSWANEAQGVQVNFYSTKDPMAARRLRVKRSEWKPFIGEVPVGTYYSDNSDAVPRFSKKHEIARRERIKADEDKFNKEFKVHKKLTSKKLPTKRFGGVKTALRGLAKKMKSFGFEW